jgi:hypothetical protein
MVKNLSRILTVGATIVGVLLFLNLIRSVGVDTLRTLLASVSLTNLLILIAMPFGTALIGTLRWWTILGAFEAKRRFRELFGLLLGARAMGYLVPGGTLVELSTLGVLVPTSSIPVVHGIGSIVVDGYIRITTNTTLLFAASLGFLAAGIFSPQEPLLMWIGVLSGLSSLVLLILLFREKSARWLSRTLARIFPGHRAEQSRIFKDFRGFFLKMQPRMLLSVILTAVNFLWEPFQIGVVLSILGFPIPFWQVFWLYYAIVYPRVIPVPAGVGFSEAGGTIFTQAIGLGSGLGLTAGLLARLKDLPAVITGLLILLFRSVSYSGKK